MTTPRRISALIGPAGFYSGIAPDVCRLDDSPRRPAAAMTPRRPNPYSLEGDPPSPRPRRARAGAPQFLGPCQHDPPPAPGHEPLLPELTQAGVDALARGADQHRQ